MSLLDDEFDLDLRLVMGPPDAPRQRPRDLDVGAGAMEGDDETARDQTCAVDTCGLDCETQTCADETCGCNTQTCDQVQCSDAITFGPYCEDASGGDDTCDACPPGGDTQGCADTDNCVKTDFDC